MRKNSYALKEIAYGWEIQRLLRSRHKRNDHRNNQSRKKWFPFACQIEGYLKSCNVWIKKHPKDRSKINRIRHESQSEGKWRANTENNLTRYLILLFLPNKNAERWMKSEKLTNLQGKSRRWKPRDLNNSRNQPQYHKNGACMDNRWRW